MSNFKETTPVLTCENVSRFYRKKEKLVKDDGTVTRTSIAKAVNGVSFDLAPGEILGVIGESGCGKSTLGRLIVRLEKTSGGNVLLQGNNVEDLIRKDRLGFRKQIQMVFQNPFDTFDPRYTVEKALVGTLKLHGIGSSTAERRDMVLEKLNASGLIPAKDFMKRFPHELSGGQLQRISILRSMLLSPKVLVADEPVSMLDISIRADIINLIYDTARAEGTAAVFISHDITTTRYIADRIAVMYLGRIVELGKADDIALDPMHPYTKALISNCSSIDPREKREIIKLEGEPPSPVNIPKGCHFAPRCPFVKPTCFEEEKELVEINGRLVRCGSAIC